MIVTIIGIALVLLAVVCLIVYELLEKSESWDNHMPWIILSAFSGIVGIIELVVAIGVIISNNVPIAQERARIQYNVRVEELASTREAILQINDDYARSVSITQYNTLVREFKEDIETTQLNLKNPWINWFNNYAYKDFDANIVSYITTLGE